jgi:hypothetical protein
MKRTNFGLDPHRENRGGPIGVNRVHVVAYCWHGLAVQAGGRTRLFRSRRRSADSRALALHALLDRVLAEGVAPVEVESDLVDLLNLARRRRYRDDHRSDRGADEGA